MQLRYTASSLFLSLLLALAGAPLTAAAQDDEDFDSEELDDESLTDDDESLDGEDDFSDSEPTLDDEDLDDDGGFEDEAEDADEALMDEGGGAGGAEEEHALTEPAKPVVDRGPLDGRLQISVTGGYGIRLGGDKTPNLFQVGYSPEDNSLDFSGMNQGPIEPSLPTLFDQARSVMDAYRKRDIDVEPKSNPFATSFGARLGYSLPEAPLYLGANFSYFTGGSITIPGQTFDTGETTATIKTTVSVMLVGGEVGLDWELADFLVLRPMIGVGAALASTELTLTGGNAPMVVPGQAALAYTPRNGSETASESTTRIYYAPALAAIVPIDMFFVSGEGRFIGISGAGGAVSFYLGASAGVALEL